MILSLPDSCRTFETASRPASSSSFKHRLRAVHTRVCKVDARTAFATSHFAKKGKRRALRLDRGSERAVQEASALHKRRELQFSRARALRASSAPTHRFSTSCRASPSCRRRRARSAAAPRKTPRRRTSATACPRTSRPRRRAAPGATRPRIVRRLLGASPGSRARYGVRSTGNELLPSYSGKWEAHIKMPNKKTEYLGTFETEVDAARAFDAKCRAVRDRAGQG